jgi:hypothetical protein
MRILRQYIYIKQCKTSLTSLKVKAVYNHKQTVTLLVTTFVVANNNLSVTTFILFLIIFLDKATTI